MPQKKGKKKLSKHGNTRSRITRSKRTRKKKSDKKGRAVGQRGGSDAAFSFPYNAIVFDVDETILPKLCGTLNSFFDRNGEFKEKVKTTEGQTIEQTITFSDDKKTKIIGTITQGESVTKKLLLNLNETESLIDLLTELKDNKVNLILKI